MSTSDTSEKGLEELIVASLCGHSETSEGKPISISELQPIYGAYYVEGDKKDYDRGHAVDIDKLFSFFRNTQNDVFQQAGISAEGPKRVQFLGRMQGEIAKRGIVDVLRNGIKHGPSSFVLFYGTPSLGNKPALKLFQSNIFSITRQLQYSNDETRLALDLCLFINGLPFATFELKNRLTKQTVEDAIQQYKRDRDPKELLFQFGRCCVHFALDDNEVWMCTYLKGNGSWFLPFNKGWNDGAGNPPNPAGIKTDYLWKEILLPESLSDIIENYAQIVEKKDEKTGKKKSEQIFPRYHQLDVVRKLLSASRKDNVGTRYLIEHSAGSGKSNSIAWLAHQLIGLLRKEKAIFDSTIVVTDRRVLDKQIKDTIKQFAQVGATVGHAERGGDLRRFIEQGKKIIITTVQKFPVILDDIGNEHRNRKFAIIIDEAHSSQGGRTSAKMNIVLSPEGGEAEEESYEDIINRIMGSRKMLANASYFAFTATPKNKTLEIFGEPYPEGEVTKHRPFHSYTMKQAIQEGFILDVLKNYTPVGSYYNLLKTIPDDPLYDTKKAQKKLRKFIESHEHAIRHKAEIMIDHFNNKVIAHRKIGGQARAMVVTSGIERAIQYYFAFKDYLAEIKYPYKAIVAFSGEHEYGGQKLTESSLNGFPTSMIEKNIQEDPYRFLIVAEKYQTGYDEPLLHTMYVDKILSGIKAVQTLSRLNRAHPQKHDTFVLDFVNDTEIIKAGFADYYRTTVLSEESDPNKLHDLKAELDGAQVYSSDTVNKFVELYLTGVERDNLDPILDACVAIYNDFDEDAQVSFKGKAKSFTRTYSFLSSILPYTNADWEKLSIFLNFLVPKLPAPPEDDLSKGILDAIDMDSYRVEVKASLDIALPDENAEVEPIPVSGGGRKSEPELDYLSNILKEFNDRFGNVEWRDADKIRKVISEEIPSKVAADKAFQNAKQNSDKENARIEHDKALQRVMTDLLSDHTELFKQFSDNPSFKKWLADTIFSVTYGARGQ